MTNADGAPWTTPNTLPRIIPIVCCAWPCGRGWPWGWLLRALNIEIRVTDCVFPVLCNSIPFYLYPYRGLSTARPAPRTLRSTINFIIIIVNNVLYERLSIYITDIEIFCFISFIPFFFFFVFCLRCIRGLINRLSTVRKLRC